MKDERAYRKASAEESEQATKLYNSIVRSLQGVVKLRYKGKSKSTSSRMLDMAVITAAHTLWADVSSDLSKDEKDMVRDMSESLRASRSN